MNASEKQVAAALTDGEHIVIKMTAPGNPDFIVIPKAAASLIRFVEVKADGDRVWSHQQTVHDSLRGDGLLVDVVHVHNGVIEDDTVPIAYGAEWLRVSEAALEGDVVKENGQAMIPLTALNRIAGRERFKAARPKNISSGVVPRVVVERVIREMTVVTR